MSRILVTGATGFIGRWTLLSLQNCDADIHGISSGNTQFLYNGHVNWHKVDLLDFRQTTQAIADIKPTHLLHLAWDVTPGKYWNAPNNLQWVQGSLNLLQSFAEQGGERVVMAGSCVEYDWTYGQYCIENVTPCHSDTLYGRSKYALQILLQQFATVMNISAAWGRIFYLYGPHEHPLRLVPSVIRSLLSKEAALCSHGKQIRDFLYVEDVAAALVALLNSNVEGYVNISSGQPLILHDLIYQIIDLNPRKQGHFLPGTGHPIISYQELKNREIDVILLMNPNYYLENLRLLAEMGLQIELLNLTDLVNK